MNIMGYVLLIGLQGGHMHLGDSLYVFRNLTDCQAEGEREMKKYATAAALSRSTPIYLCKEGFVSSDGVYHIE